MKKIICLVLALLMMISLASCAKKEEVQKEEENIGIANPIKEYDSLDKINEITKCHIVIPASFGVSDAVYSTINDEAAQVTFTYMNHKWTIRGSHDTNNNLSGIQDINENFTPGEDFGVYLNDYYVDIMFTEGQQYSIVMETPEINDEEMFSDTTFEIRKVIKNACDPNGIAGSYMDSTSQRATMEISKYDDQYEITVDWANDASSYKEWVMAATLEDGLLKYEGEDIYNWVTDANGDMEMTDYTTSNNVGKFEVKDGKLYWTGAAEESCRTCVFEKVQ